jgi:hypothetical protein
LRWPELFRRRRARDVSQQGEPAERVHHVETPEITGAPDRLRTLKDAELDLPCVIEGACAHFNGRPLEANRWPRNYPQYWEGWRHGWIEASLYRAMWGSEEEARWREEVPS